MTAFFAVALALAAATPATAQTRDFTLINATGKAVSEVYVSASATDDWEEDVLGVDTLDPGQRVNISFPGTTKACLHDLKLVHSNGDTAEWTSINLCEVSVVSARYDKKGDPIADTE